MPTLLGKTTAQQKKNHFFSSLFSIHKGNINQKQRENRDDHHFWHRPKHPLPDSYVNDRPSIYETYSTDRLRHSHIVRRPMPKSVTQSETHTHKKYKWATKQLQSFRPSGEIKNQKKTNYCHVCHQKKERSPIPLTFSKNESGAQEIERCQSNLFFLFSY